jgi:hypothetical protein
MDPYPRSAIPAPCPHPLLTVLGRKDAPRARPFGRPSGRHRPQGSCRHRDLILSGSVITARNIPGPHGPHPISMQGRGRLLVAPWMIDPIIIERLFLGEGDTPMLRPPSLCRGILQPEPPNAIIIAVPSGDSRRGG